MMNMRSDSQSEETTQDTTVEICSWPEDRWTKPSLEGKLSNTSKVSASTSEDEATALYTKSTSGENVILKSLATPALMLCPVAEQVSVLTCVQMVL